MFRAVSAAHEAEHRAHAAKRIRVEHGIGHLKNWRALSRHPGRCEHLETVLPTVAGLVSSQERAPRVDQLRRPLTASPAGTAGRSTRPGQVNGDPPLIMDEVVSLYAVLRELQALLATGTGTGTGTGTVCGQRIDTRSEAPT